MVFALNTTVRAADYDITVCVDETTAGDLAMVESFMSNAADGATVSRSLRRVAMAAVGEVCLALNARVDSYGSLTLDDGGVIALAEGDFVAVGERYCREVVAADTERTKVKIKFSVLTLPNGIQNCRPIELQLSQWDRDRGGWHNLFMRIPPTDIHH